MTRYNCLQCPGYCCSHDRIAVSDFDIRRLARHFGVDPDTAERRYVKIDSKGKVLLRHRRDVIFDSACMFLDQKKRQCTVYDARPGVCRKFPDTTKCGYYEFLKFERAHQDDPKFIALT